MRIRLLCVGKEATKHYDTAIHEYLTRLRPRAAIALEVVPSSGLELESSQLLKRMQGRDVVVLLDERGDQWSTPELAAQIERWQNNATKSVAFVIGGAFGVSQEVRDRADVVFSLSRLVLPHELVRLLIVEQLYRAYDIIHGGKYHHS